MGQGSTQSGEPVTRKNQSATANASTTRMPRMNNWLCIFKCKAKHAANQPARLPAAMKSRALCEQPKRPASMHLIVPRCCCCSYAPAAVATNKLCRCCCSFLLQQRHLHMSGKGSRSYSTTPACKPRAVQAHYLRSNDDKHNKGIQQVVKPQQPQQPSTTAIINQSCTDC